MPPVIGELDVTVIAAEVGDAMFAAPLSTIRYDAFLEAFGNA
jgi:hypothetical protein